ncbi:MAG: hypothetical protein GY896_22950 [Gammaproteobacteria bacterium]|nr:hypothetical protein [Gammaproteobacteria bacterium]
MVQIALSEAGPKYHGLAKGIPAAGARALTPVMAETARDVITKHFVGPVGTESKKKPLATKIVSRSGQLASTVGPIPTTVRGGQIIAGIKMEGIQARGLEEGNLISHPGNVGKLQVFKPKGSRRLVFTRKTRAHLIPIRARWPLKKTMKRWRKKHLATLNAAVGQAAAEVGLVAKIRRA